ncbi:MAG TPA: YfhO family protein [Thermoanaerobaculia bacterium]|jgi:hypothetical protein|nr:YfhO family protein [Thermoanaerobaculia bacterium]
MTGGPTARRQDVWAVVLLALVATLFFADVLAGINNFFIRDLTRYYYPTKQILREIVLHGEFPYWNRYFSAGQPIAANPEHEVFYPFTWLILLPSYDFGYRLHILIHIYIGLFGMYALLRSMELRPFAAFIGALGFGVGGCYLSYINLLPILFCAAWLPLTCLFVRRFLLQHRARDFALAALFLGMQFLVGEPTTILQTGFLIGMYALYRGWYARPRITKMLTGVLWIGLISAGGLAIGAAQVLPALDHVRDSARSRPFGFDLVSAWSMPWAKLSEVIYPHILGHISIKQVMWYWGSGLYPGMGSPFVFSIYFGLLLTACAIGGAFVRPRGGRFVLILTLFSVLMALGGHTPVLEWLYDHHIAMSIRYPEKFILIAAFAAVIFGAQMLDRIVHGDEGVREGTIGFLLAVLLVAVILAVLSWFPIYARGMMKIWGWTPGAALDYMMKVTRIDWIVACARAGALLALLLLIRRIRRPVWVTIVGVLVIADLFYAGNELNPRMPRRFFQPPPVAAQFPTNREPFRIFHEADWYGQEEIAKQYFSTGNAVYWVVRNGLFPMTPAGSRLRTVLERDYDKTALLPTIDLTDSVWDVKRSGRADWYRPFMAMSNAWYRALYRNFEVEKKRNRNNFKESLPLRFEEGKHYPRYYFADQLVTIKDRNDFVKKLSNGSYSDAVAFLSQPSFVPARGVVHGVRETANHATIDVESFGQGFLVMSITPHKYWRVTMDGQAVTPVVTNIGYQGVTITPGRHRVEMQYVNELVRVGGLVSALAFVLLGGIALRRPRPRAELAAYEEPVHVVADDAGLHVEPAEPEEPLPIESPS